MRKHSNGVTLIELMITVAIVAILAAIAYPSYINQIQRSNRTVAKTTLMTYAQSLERCYTQNATYVGCGTVITDSSAFDSGKNLYAIVTTVSIATPSIYTITANAQNAQAGDTDCASFSLTETGVRTPLTGCW